MSEVSASVVMELRKRTGSGLMKCKEALAETGGDMEKAVEYLRKKGMASAEKKADREAKHGKVFARINGSVGAMAEINCETDFVARNEAFDALGEKVLDLVIAGQDVPDEIFKEAIAKLGENIKLGQSVRYDAGGGEVHAYIHAGALIGALVQGVGLGPEAGKDLAMQIAAQSPGYVRPEDVPEDILAKEREIYEELCRKEGKPEAAWPKIIEGRVQKWFAENTLLEQEHWRESKVKVKDALPKGATVEKFARFQLGA